MVEEVVTVNRAVNSTKIMEGLNLQFKNEIMQINVDKLKMAIMLLVSPLDVILTLR